MVGTGIVFFGITCSLIYVVVLRVKDKVQTSGVVPVVSDFHTAHTNEQLSALITASRLFDGNKMGLGGSHGVVTLTTGDV